MRAPAIMPQEPGTVLRLGPAGLRSGASWTQEDSDVVAHFIQVHGQIAKSTWLQNRATLESCGDMTSGTFPDLESFVYVAVYFRQLFSRRDGLFADACDRYIRAVDSPAKAAWLHREKEAGLGNWKSATLMIPDYTTEQLFDAMLYGTHLIHSLPATWKQHRDAFRDMLTKTPRERLLFELHRSLSEMFNYVSSASAVIYQDFAGWLHSGAAPLPDVMWHEPVFLSEVVHGNAPSR